MSLNVDELVEKSKDQYNRKRYSESLISAEAAIEIDACSVNAYWYYALSQIALDDNESALAALEVVVDLDPYFVNGLNRYGLMLSLVGRNEEAQTAYEMAFKQAPNHLTSLNALADIYSDSKNSENDEKEVLVLTNLEKIQDLTIPQKHRVGNIHYKNENFNKTIKYWNYGGPISLFNLGIVYNNRKVLRKADAIDVWRLSENRYTSDERTLAQIKAITPRLVALHERALKSNPTLINSDKWYQYYINPFELFDIPDGEFDDIDEINVKDLQKYKKILLKEIELEDGIIPWVDKLHIDRSRALGICDSIINDETERQYHWQVFINKPLLGFLSRGEHRHFMVDAQWSPLETLEFLDEDNDGFRKWLSPSFSKQFDLILTTAITNNDLTIVEVLLSGRLWVDLTYSELCFEGARTKIGQYMEGLRKAETQANDTKPNYNSIENLSNHNSLLKLLNLFPAFLIELQDEFATNITNIAISCHNEYDDSDLAVKILSISRGLIFKSAKVTNREEENLETITDIIQNKRVISIIDDLRKINNECKNNKPSVADVGHIVDQLISDIYLKNLKNKSTELFVDIFDQVYVTIRDISVSCYNNHSDTLLSKEILLITNRIYSLISKESENRLKTDIDTINELIKEEHKSDVLLTFGSESCSIRKEGIRKGTTFIPASSVHSVRWGTMVKEGNVHDFLFVFRSTGGIEIKLQWSTSKNLDEQEKYSQQLVEAIFQYILPDLIERLKSRIKKGIALHIGNCVVAENGIGFETKSWLSTKQVLIPWHRANYSFNNGELIIMDKTSSKTKVALSLRNIDNAFTIQYLQD